MATMDIYSIYRNMERDNIILSFKGDITKDLLSSVYQIIEVRLENDNQDPKRKKKFFHVLVECLQNMYHHMESLQTADAPVDAEINSSAIFVIGRTGDQHNYSITTGNFLHTESADSLKEKIDVINNMNPTELKAYYLERLGATELSEKGGAGLGIIEIARKSGNKIGYDFKPISDKFSFFTLSVTVN